MQWWANYLDNLKNVFEDGGEVPIMELI